MKVWEIQNAYGIENLNLVEKPEQTPGPGQVVVSIKASDDGPGIPVMNPRSPAT